MATRLRNVMRPKASKPSFSFASPAALIRRRAIVTTTTTTTTIPPAGMIQVLESVHQALRKGKPVVALESTIVAHGMPYPQNLELSQEVGRLLRERGVEPATIALKNGVCRIGLSPEELQDLASASLEPGRVVQKCSTREMGLFLAQHCSGNNEKPAWGATTVASTMVLAHQAGIKVFVTGGIGGVHRHGEVSMDISADLQQLAQTPVIVVSAGIKSILDIPRTLEVLETNGVPIVAWQTNEFPAFFSPKSNVQTPARVDDAQTVANAYQKARELQLNHGMLVAVPNQTPAEGEAVEAAIQAALAEAEERQIHGRDVTPFLLKRVAETTEGASLRSNLSLVKQNAIVGAEIAIALSELEKQHRHQHKGLHASLSFPATGLKASVSDDSLVGPTNQELVPSKVVVMGGMATDTVARPTGNTLLLRTSNPARSSESDGGVGRNVAEVLGRLGLRPILYSAIGQDGRGQSLVAHLLQDECNVQVQARVVEGASTASYLAVLEADGDLHTACADMEVLQHIPIPPLSVLQEADFLVVDANAPAASLLAAVQRAHSLGVQVFLEPTSVPKAIEIGQHRCSNSDNDNGDIMAFVTFASPNIEELCALVDGWNTPLEEMDMIRFEAIQDLSRRLLQRMNHNSREGSSGDAHVLVTMSDKGLMHAHKISEQDSTKIVFQHYPVERPVSVANATGAGDSLVGAFLHALIQGDSVDSAIRAGMKAAMQSLECSNRAVSPSISAMSGSRSSSPR